MSAVLDFAIALTFRPAAVSPDPYRVASTRHVRRTYGDLGRGELDREIAARRIICSLPAGRRTPMLQSGTNRCSICGLIWSKVHIAS